MVLSLADTVKLSSTIDILTEVNVVNLIDVALVHVAAENFLCDVLGGVNLKQVDYAQELKLGNVTVLSTIEVLEAGLQVDAADLDSPSVLLHNLRNLVLTGTSGALKVLAASEKGIVLGNGWHAGVRCLIDAGGGKSLVD